MKGKSRPVGKTMPKGEKKKKVNLKRKTEPTLHRIVSKNYAGGPLRNLGHGKRLRFQKKLGTKTKFSY